MLEEGRPRILLLWPGRSLLKVMLVPVELSSRHLDHINDSRLCLRLSSIKGSSCLEQVLEGTGLRDFREQVSALLVFIVVYATGHLRVAWTRGQTIRLLALRSYLSYRNI